MRHRSARRRDRRRKWHRKWHRASGRAAAAAAVVTALAVALPLMAGTDPTPRVASVPSDSAPTEVDPAPVEAVPTVEPSRAEDLQPPAALDPDRRSTDDPASLWVVVNKARPIRPGDYRPRTRTVRGYQVAGPVAGPLKRLLDDSDRRGLGLRLASAFRSLDYQRGVYAETVGRLGREVADTRSARPGHSEHQTGLAVDLVASDTPGCDFDTCFGDTPGGRWVARNAWRYGFVVRYREGDTVVTGYSPEPWHLRYVGRPLATELRRTGATTLEEFFDVRGGDYADQG